MSTPETEIRLAVKQGPNLGLWIMSKPSVSRLTPSTGATVTCLYSLAKSNCVIDTWQLIIEVLRNLHCGCFSASTSWFVQLHIYTLYKLSLHCSSHTLIFYVHIHIYDYAASLLNSPAIRCATKLQLTSAVMSTESI